jgi:hypothetical protein
MSCQCETASICFINGGCLEKSTKWDTEATTQPAAPVVDAKDRRIQFLEGLLKAYGPKSLQYDIEHPNDGLNAATSVPPAVELPPLPPMDCTYADHSYPAYKCKTVEKLYSDLAACVAAARSAPVGVPEGWKAVPCNIPDSMRIPLLQALGLPGTSINVNKLKRGWHKALAAAPSHSECDSNGQTK